MIHHDIHYSFLFDHPEIVEELLRLYVARDWQEDILFSSLKKEDTKLQSLFGKSDGKRRAGDRLWSAELKGGGRCFFLLIEFQSEVDPFMPVRLLVYVALVYDLLVRTGRVKAGERLPAVLPVVIYNGEAPWTAARSLASLIDLDRAHPMWRWQPQMRYLVVEEGKERPDKPGILPLLFAIDTVGDPETLSELLESLRQALRETPSRLRTDILGWLRNSAAAYRFDLGPAEVGLGEGRSMLAQRLAQFAEDYKEKGREEGRQEGRVAAGRRMLQEIVTLRFGGATWAQLAPRILAIEDPDALEGLVPALLRAESVDALLRALEA